MNSFNLTLKQAGIDPSPLVCQTAERRAIPTCGNKREKDQMERDVMPKEKFWVSCWEWCLAAPAAEACQQIWVDVRRQGVIVEATQCR